MQKQARFKENDVKVYKYGVFETKMRIYGHIGVISGKSATLSRNTGKYIMQRPETPKTGET